MLVSCLAVLGCGQLPGHPKPGPEVPRPDSVTDFSTLYRENCSACHGAQGMNGPSYPLANPEYQALVDEQVLHQVVANGEPGTLMPAFSISAGGSLTDQQVDALVQGMRAAWYRPELLLEPTRRHTTPPQLQTFLAERRSTQPIAPAATGLPDNKARARLDRLPGPRSYR
jgi:mono/diheme cytochrome c family protein